MRTLLCWALIAWAAAPKAARAESDAESGTGSESVTESATDSESDSEADSEAEPESPGEDSDTLAGGPSDSATSTATSTSTDTDTETDSDPLCLSDAIELRRFGSDRRVTLSLTRCDGQPNLDALAALSALAQPLQQAPSLPDVPAAVLDADQTVVQLNAGLLVRLQRLVEHFPGHGIEIVSGYRPHAHPGSRHRSADALDLRIEDVDNFELSEFARTLEATGVGYYPNSTFVHVDVRATEAYWVDRSGPGEKADYGPWPRKQQTAAPAETASSADEETAPAENAAAEGIAADTDAPQQDAQEPEPNDAGTDSADAPDPELKALSDRALVIMKLADESSAGTLTESDAP